jgi:hypothetical protein
MAASCASDTVTPSAALAATRLSLTTSYPVAYRSLVMRNEPNVSDEKVPSTVPGAVAPFGSSTSTVRPTHAVRSSSAVDTSSPSSVSMAARSSSDAPRMRRPPTVVGSIAVTE